MTNLELKRDLHSMIDQVEDDNLLSELISFLRDNEGIKQYRTAVEEGDSDIRSGKIHAHEDVEKYFSEKYKTE